MSDGDSGSVNERLEAAKGFLYRENLLGEAGNVGWTARDFAKVEALAAFLGEREAKAREQAFREAKVDCGDAHSIEAQRCGELERALAISTAHMLTQGERINALKAERNGIISRLRARWPHIEIVSYRSGKPEPVDPGPMACLRCCIEDEIGDPWHDGLGPPRGAAK